jgi:class 3 adenylate cyclase
MSITLDEQIQQLKQAIADLEAQRSILGDAAVEAALIPSRQKLAELEAQAEPSREEPPEIPTRQRKLATILFMDVVGSTEMTRDLDPEDQMALVDPLIARLGEKVSEFGGHVARYTGDGFKAVFGLPLARENDPEQAIRAGLAIQAEASEIASKLANEHGITEFKVRMGITTGLVFAGGETEGEDTIKGNPVNLAARLQSAASPGGLLISHDTYRHVRGVFNVDPIEPITAKGFPEPAPVYLVRELKPRAFRVLSRGVEGVETRMVGRETELKFLQDALMTAFEEGEGQVVTISGEAGVGKSRLLYEFQNHACCTNSKTGLNCCPQPKPCSFSREAAGRKPRDYHTACCATFSLSASRSWMKILGSKRAARSRWVSVMYLERVKKAS